MLELVTAGLVVALIVLLIVRSTRRADASASSSAGGSAVEPPAPTAAPARPHQIDTDVHLWESRRIARRGEERAASLDLFGYLLVGLVAVIVVMVPATLVGARESTSQAERVAIALGAAGAALVVSALAAILLGFGAVVRNSSRSLAIAADQALDLTDPIDDE